MSGCSTGGALALGAAFGLNNSATKSKLDP